jgi:lysophospholipase L1-like esterase
MFLKGTALIMFEVLCYGDSNTWGADPAKGGRFSRNDRWPSVLQNVTEFCGNENG